MPVEVQQFSQKDFEAIIFICLLVSFVICLFINSGLKGYLNHCALMGTPTVNQCLVWSNWLCVGPF